MGQRTDVHSNPSSIKGGQDSKTIFILIRHLLVMLPDMQFRVGVNLRISISQLK